MPEYIGEVRTMVIAATNGQYGAASVNSTVNKPLMVSVALPRLFTPGDVIDIPVTVFVLKDHIREVTVKMTTDDKITLTGEKEQPGCRHFGQKRHRAMKQLLSPRMFRYVFLIRE